MFLIALVQEPLDLESLSANTVGFVPMDFCGADTAVFEPDGSTSFELTPASRPILSAQAGEGSKLKELRSRKRLSQVELAKRIGSSQLRVAKIEAADPSVSLDLVVRSLIALGATRKNLAKVIASPTPRAAA